MTYRDKYRVGALVAALALLLMVKCTMSITTVKNSENVLIEDSDKKALLDNEVGTDVSVGDTSNRE